MPKKTLNPVASSDSRIQILDFPQAAPGHCAICGYAGGIENDDRKFVDWGFSLDFFGAVIICTTCVQTIANALGFLSVVQSEDLLASSFAMVNQVAELEEENGNLRSAIGSLGLVSFASGNSEQGNPPQGQNDSGIAESASSGGPEIVSDSESGSESESDSLIDL